jgi:hypothetical protein
MRQVAIVLAVATALILPRSARGDDPAPHPVFEVGPPTPAEQAYQEIDHDKRDFALAVLADTHGKYIAAMIEFEAASRTEDTAWMECTSHTASGLDALLEVAREAEIELREALAGGDAAAADHQMTRLHIAGKRAGEATAASCEDVAPAPPGRREEPADPPESVFVLEGRPWYVRHPLAATGLDVAGAGISGPGQRSPASFSLGPHATLAPGLALSTVVDSNVTLSSADPRRDLRLSLLPHARLAVDTAAVYFGVEGEYALDKVAGAAQGDGASHGGAGLDRLSDGHLGVDLVTTPGEPVSFVLGNHLVHRTELAEAAGVGPAAAASIFRLGMLTNHSRLGADVRPTTALTLSGWVQADLGRHSLASVVDGTASQAQLHSQYLDLHGGFATFLRFFPHTRLRADASLGRLSWSPSAQVAHREAQHWQVRGGLEGDLSRKVGIRALAGYGALDAAGTEEGDVQGTRGIVCDVWLAWRPHPTQQFQAGVVRDAGPVHLGDHLLTSSAVVRYQGLVAGQLLPSVEVAYSRHEIRGDDPRDDHEVRGRAALALAPDDRFRVGLHYDVRALVATNSGAPFTDHRVGLTLELGAPGANLPWLPSLPRNL